MRIGIDFDNTLIDYDGVFVAAARQRGLIGPECTGSKRAVRDAIRRLPEGELTWQHLQGHVYGAGIGGAVRFAGAAEFLARCAAEGVGVFIVSHKTRYGHHDPARIDLREAARQWMMAQGMMAQGMVAQGILTPTPGAIPADHVFFEDDRQKKLSRIGALRCTHFIDDLEEVFADPSFPAGVRRVLFAPIGAACCDVHCTDWLQISKAIFGNVE
jgi:hypothetical protein